MSADHVYAIYGNDVTIVGDATLSIVHTATGTARGSLVEILRAEVSQRSTDTSDQLGFMIGEKASAFGTYTSFTPEPWTFGGPASGITGGTAGAAGTAGIDASAEGAGAFTAKYPLAFNNLNGWLWVPTPEERCLVLPDKAAALKLIGTPAVLTGWFWLLLCKELV